MKNRLIALALAGALLLGLAPGAKASQGTGCMPTTGTVSGLSFALDVNAAIAAIISSNSGSTVPATDCTAVPIKGQIWLNTSVTPNLWQMYDGTSWVTVSALDTTNHFWSPPIGGGTGTVTAASTTDLCASPSALQTVLGTTAITSFGSNCVAGIRKTLIFNAATPLTYNATSLILPGLTSYTTAAGDVADAVYLGSGNWRIVSLAKIDGSAIANPSVPLGTVLFGDFGTLPAKAVYGFGQALTRTSFPQYLAAVTRAQTGTLTSGNATITSIANTAGFNAGMPVEGAAGITTGCTIASVVANSSITLNSSTCVTINGTTTVSVFLTGYGAGGSTSTVGVKDCRGSVIAGRDNLGGTAAGRLTTSYFGGAAGFGANGLNAFGGGESFTMALGNLISHTHANVLNFSDPGHSHSKSWSSGVPSQDVNNTTTGGGSFGSTAGNGGTDFTIAGATTNISASITNVAAGSASPTPMRTAQPTVIADCIVWVLP